MEAMINNNNLIALKNRVSVLFKNNIKTIIFIFLSIILIIIFFQYYMYKKDNEVLELSILYDQAKADINSNNFDEIMNLISKDSGFFGILASLELMKKSLNNKDYQYAYNKYLELLKNNKSKEIYNSIIALHGAYNLIDYISTDNILILLSFVDESSISFVGYKDELEYLISIKNNDIVIREKLSNKILKNENVPEAIKERVRKLNELQKYR